MNFNVCPVQFAHYLRLRAVTDTDTMCSNKRSNEMYVEEYSEHMGICGCKFQSNVVGRILVPWALHQYCKTITSESSFKHRTVLRWVTLKGGIST